MPQRKKNARILLEDGTEFEGYAFGHEKSAAGELTVFTGQPDPVRLLTDPAVRGTIVLLPQPLTGATGAPPNEMDEFNLERFQESPGCQAAGLITSQVPTEVFHYQAKKTFPRWLKTQQIPGIYGVDTRALVQRVMMRGTCGQKFWLARIEMFHLPRPRVITRAVMCQLKARSPMERENEK